MPIELVDNVYVTRWTTADEAKLQELQDRKRVVMGANRERLVTALRPFVVDDFRGEELADKMIPLADELIAALRPFSTTQE